MRRDFTPTVYMLASKRNGTLYTGVTSAPRPRWYQHRTGQVRGFTSDYGVKMLVWFEQHETMEEAVLSPTVLGYCRGHLQHGHPATRSQVG